MRIVLVRHATTDWNTEDRVQGHKDIPLNDLGREEARALAELVRSHAVVRVVSSPLRRSRETGAIIAAILGVPHAVHAGLLECGFGSLEGLPMVEFRERAAPLCAAESSLIPMDDLLAYDFRTHGGEDADAVTARQLACFDALRSELGDHVTVCCVGHGRSLGTVLARYWKHPPIHRGATLAFEYPHHGAV